MQPKHAILRSLLVLLVLATMAFAQTSGLEWSTFLGGQDGDSTSVRRGGVLPTGDGDLLVWGSTRSRDFPVKNAFDATYNGGTGSGDGWIARIKADGTGLVWSTYIGGSGNDSVLGLELGSGGAITICGKTTSTDFPTTTRAFDRTYHGKQDGFVSRFVWNGQRLEMVWSTLIGGIGEDDAFQLAVHPTGKVLLAGTTSSGNFPIRGKPYQPKIRGIFDGYVAVLNSDGSDLLASTFIGGSSTDAIQDLTLDASKNPVVSGWTYSSNFPTTARAFQRARAGDREGFIARFDVTLGRLTYATLLGGAAFDAISQVQVIDDDRIYAAGWTASTGFPVTNGAFATKYNGGANDGFVALLDPHRSGTQQLLWSTFVGGKGGDGVNTLAVERSGLITVAGTAGSADFPTTPGAYDTTFGGGMSPFDAFVTRFDPNQTGTHELVYSTFLGGSSNYDYAYSVATATDGSTFVVGPTVSTDFPTTTGSFDRSHNGGDDVFVSKLTMLPRGVARTGTSTPACAWPIYQGVDSWPARGNATFAVRATGAAPLSPAFLVLGTSATTLGIPLFNVSLFVQSPLLTLPTISDRNGYARAALPIPSSASLGTKVGLQWLFLTTRTCPGTGLLSASEAIEVTVQ